MTTAATGYPVHVRARLDPGLSRWLWLVKWFLAIPHYLVLAFLWLGFVVFSVVAFFAILFTGRYPRVLFDFNLGVLRWSWRVAYYTYGALATDRYPPFSLGTEPDYPATLDIAYPEHLSRGLVLVKWWLLAIPHYLIVGFFVGGGSYVAYQTGQTVYNSGGGLVGLMALFAGVALLFTGRYPNGLFDFVLGMDRWALRVAAYAGLMTDTYPPFRFDSGGDEPGTTTIDQAPPPPAPGHQGWTPGRVAAVVIGALLMMTGGAVGGTGGFGLWADSTQRDAAGFLSTGSESFRSAGYALELGTLELRWTDEDWVLADNWLGEVRLKADDDVFIGIGRTNDVTRYLSGVEHDEVSTAESRVTYWHRDGGSPADPGAQTFWAASGTGEVTWRAEQGSWTAVVLNADRSRVVDTSLAAQAEVPVLRPLSFGLIIGGGVMLLLGLVVMLVAALTARQSRRNGTTTSVR
ncbi:DUF4389 domain-containing protein [Lentzea flaviverrucosa]|uniref:DUF4389 domain-containing protein n=1 Tax=Lentzea flaviverrucosa TaxID=200379 RepID=A0A1H9XWP6_9PSEU|nr:DUF4389 domain-containing protein [Lentzea flaviverrucosa]RDI34330.1 uncharacterized protein DUF4389 [Lentzea flaviverrucosa]SES50499.1 protein of unknown function [Lentzea flaviverrucosa]